MLRGLFPEYSHAWSPFSTIDCDQLLIAAVRSSHLIYFVIIKHCNLFHPFFPPMFLFLIGLNFIQGYTLFKLHFNQFMNWFRWPVVGLYVNHLINFVKGYNYWKQHITIWPFWMHIFTLKVLYNFCFLLKHTIISLHRKHDLKSNQSRQCVGTYSTWLN